MNNQDFPQSISQVLMSPSSNTKLDKKENDKLQQTFLEVWNEAVKHIPVPKWCDSEKLANTLAYETEQYYIERRLDERIDKVMKCAKNSGEVFNNYVLALDEYCESMQKMFLDEQKRKPSAFYRSDFPISILSRFDLIKHTQIKAYNYLSIWANSFLGKAYVYRGNWIKFNKKILIPFSKESRIISGASNNADRACGSLLAYIRIWNVSEYSELLQDKALSKTKLDQKVFDKLYLEFEKNLYELQDTIRTLKPELYRQPIKQNEVTEMIGKTLLLNQFWG